LRSGDGRSADSAYVTISIAEEYEVLSAFGLSAKSQSVVNGCDLFVVEDEDGEEHAIYFFPELHWKRLSELFPE
jgi:hypothetical protein